MMDSINLINAQISFLPPRLALIHVPVEHYTIYLQPILRLLFAEHKNGDDAARSWTNNHDFLNVTITTGGCSIICTRYLADTYFVPVQRRYPDLVPEVKIVDDTDYIVIQVDGQGFDAGQRVLELTSPLAMAGISIFFVTTYFSDFIMVPANSRQTVTTALEQRGFVFSKSADAFVSQLSPASPYIVNHRRDLSSEWVVPLTGHGSNMPSTPPAKDLPELQRRTFAKLRKSQIQPVLDRELRLVACAGNSDEAMAADVLKNDLLQILLEISPDTLRRKPPFTNGNHVNQPIQDSSCSFLSITITAKEPISIFLETKLLDRLGSSLLGNKDPGPEDILIPITFDLEALPVEATGIVCGVAGCLATGNTGIDKDLGTLPNADGVLDITFLSTALAGTVLLKEADLDRAMLALEYGMSETGSG